MIKAVRAAARADVDLDAHSLLAVRGLARYRHPCGCFGLGVVAAHRVGRDGVDVTLSVDVTPPVTMGAPLDATPSSAPKPPVTGIQDR